MSLPLILVESLGEIILKAIFKVLHDGLAAKFDRLWTLGDQPLYCLRELWIKAETTNSQSDKRKGKMQILCQILPKLSLLLRLKHFSPPLLLYYFVIRFIFVQKVKAPYTAIPSPIPHSQQQHFEVVGLTERLAQVSKSPSMTVDFNLGLPHTSPVALVLHHHF